MTDSYKEHFVDLLISSRNWVLSVNRTYFACFVVGFFFSVYYKLSVNPEMWFLSHLHLYV